MTLSLYKLKPIANHSTTPHTSSHPQLNKESINFHPEFLKKKCKWRRMTKPIYLLLFILISYSILMILICIGNSPFQKLEEWTKRKKIFFFWLKARVFRLGEKGEKIHVSKSRWEREFLKNQSKTFEHKDKRRSFYLKIWTMKITDDKKKRRRKRR